MSDPLPTLVCMYLICFALCILGIVDMFIRAAKKSDE